MTTIVDITHPSIREPEPDRRYGLPPDPDLQALSPRQREVLGMLRSGLTREQIAARLSMTSNAVRKALSEGARRLPREPLPPVERTSHVAYGSEGDAGREHLARLLAPVAGARESVRCSACRLWTLGAEGGRCPTCRDVGYRQGMKIARPTPVRRYVG